MHFRNLKRWRKKSFEFIIQKTPSSSRKKKERRIREMTSPEDDEEEEEIPIEERFVVNKRLFHLHLESTKEAFWQWYRDQLSLESDEEHFPLHQHGDHDFFHDQLEQQDDYYYNPTIYGPKGDSQNYLWNLAFKDESDTEHLEYKRQLEPYFQDQERRRRQQRQQLRPDHE
jgi:hypothetical protein